jgi:hypothetical protein
MASQLNLRATCRVSSDCFQRTPGSLHLRAGEDAFAVAAFHFNADVAHSHARLQVGPAVSFSAAQAAAAARDPGVVSAVRANDTGFRYIILFTEVRRRDKRSLRRRSDRRLGSNWRAKVKYCPRLSDNICM